MRYSLRVVLCFLLFSAPIMISAQPSSQDPNYTATLLASGLNLPWGGVIYRPASHDLLVNLENSPAIQRIDATTGAISTFATIPSNFHGDRGAYAFEMAINSRGEVWVTMYSNTGPVVRFDSSGNFLGSFPITAYGEGGATFDKNDNFYIAEGPDGNSAGTIYEYAAGTYANPVVFASGFGSVLGLAFNASGQLFASDYIRGNIYQVTPGGMTEASHVVWASGVTSATPLAINPVDQTILVGRYQNPNITRVTSLGVSSTFATGFTSADALGFDPAGDLYVADLMVGAIWKFTRNSTTSALAISPVHGGNAGPVTVRITGQGLESGATVTLTNPGGNIQGTNTTLLSSGILATTFDLTGATPGSGDVTIANPDGTSLTLPAAFTVDQGGAPQISADIIGLEKIRIGTPQQYYVAVTNQGSVDSPPGIVSISIPSTVGATPLNGSNLFIAGVSDDPETQIPGPANVGGAPAALLAAAAASTSNQSVLFATPSVPAGTTQYAPIQFTLPLTGPASFIATAIWQQNITNLTLDDVLDLEGIGFLPLQVSCTQCSSQYLSQLTAWSNASTAYLALKKSVSDVELAKVNFYSAVGEAVAATVVLSSVESVVGGIVLGTVINQAYGCLQANDFALPTAQSCIGNLSVTFNSLLNADVTFLQGPLSPLVKSEAQVMAGALQIAINAMNGAANISNAYQTEQLALATFNQALGPYIAARSSYQTCVTANATTCNGQQPPPPPNPPGTTNLPITGVGSLDPNSKVGTHGAGSQQFISGITGLNYSVGFENELTATAPAQVVSISDQLNPASVDLETFSFGPIAFGDQILFPLQYQTNFAATVDMRPSTNLLVQVSASLDPSTGLSTWSYKSIDPDTNLPPADPTVGFLPPGGDGNVFFTVMPKQALATNTQIPNQATVVFDSNAPILTPTWANTLDNTAPVSHVSALPGTVFTQSFTVNWSGTDVGAGIQDFTVYVSDNGAAFAPWITNTTAASAVYSGQVGHSYAFYSIARDLVGNIEAGKSSSETVTAIHADPTPPAIAPAVTGTVGTNGWYTSSVTLSWAVTDPESGVSSTTGCSSAAVTTSTAGTTFTCSATNNAGLNATSTITLKVDLAAPVLSLPSPITVTAGSSSGVVVSYTATAADNLDPNPAVVCTPASGSTFAIGTTTVNCAATDAAGNHTAGTFTVTVSASTAGNADLALINLASPTVKSGKQLTYLIAAANLGPNTARSVTISDSLPAGTTLVSAVYAVESCTAAGGVPVCPAPPARARCTSVGNQVTCAIGDLPAFTAKQPTGVGVLITVQVSAPVGTRLVDTARIMTLTADPRTGNNAFTAVSTVTR